MSVMTTVLDGATRPVVRRRQRAPRPAAAPVKPTATATATLLTPSAAPSTVALATPAALVAPVVIEAAAVATVESSARWQTVAASPTERAWGVLAHLSGAVASAAGPILVARLAGRHSEYVREQAVAAANFQLAFLATLAPFVLVGVLTLGIAALFVVPLALAWLLTTVLAATAAADGERYRYPVTLHLVR